MRLPRDTLCMSISRDYAMVNAGTMNHKCDRALVPLVNSILQRAMHEANLKVDMQSLSTREAALELLQDLD